MIADWLEEHRFVTLSLALIIIFLSIMAFLFVKADEITRDPCSICSEKHGSAVQCTVLKGIPVSKTYLPNGSDYSNVQDIQKMISAEFDKRSEIDEINISNIFGN